MKCPFCQNSDTRVVDSRPIEEGAALRRRRQCDQCGERFTTQERPTLSPMFVVKRDGRREEFSSLKLRGGLLKACSKRPVSVTDVEAAVAAIETQLRRDGSAEVPAERIGELVMERLLSLDQVAYVRFASVYQQFDDVKLFVQLLERIGRRSKERTEESHP